jgi:hypothetical protein
MTLAIEDRRKTLLSKVGGPSFSSQSATVTPRISVAALLGIEPSLVTTFQEAFMR